MMNMSTLTGLRSTVDRVAPGVARIYRKYRDDHTRRYEQAAPTPWGFSLIGDEGLASSRASSHESDLFLQLLAQSDHVIDVGANVGLFTLLAASKGVPVTSIEPSPLNLDVLYRNLRLNAFQAEVLPVALADRTGLADLFGAGQGASLRKGWGGMASTYTTTVPVHTLDGLLTDRLQGRRLLVKIDAEGLELPILRGAARLIANSPAPTWVVEIGLTENFAGGVNPDFAAIFNLFWRAGYAATCVEQVDRPVTAEDVLGWVADGERGFWNINYVFRRG